MNKKYFLLITLLLITNMMLHSQKTIYDFKVKDIDGKTFDMSKLKGKKVMVVNVASRCGLTPQYEQLENLYELYKDSSFVIVAFPSNDFKGQEPGTNEEIKEFCSLTYGVTFPMMDKVKVIGESKDPVYKWLTEKSENGVLDSEVQWNFQKFLIDEEGNLVMSIPPKESPLSDKIINWLNN